MLDAFAVIFFLVACILVGTALVAWRLIGSPAVDLFALVPGTLGIGSFIISFGFVTSNPTFVLGATISTALIIPIPWILFSFDYIGKDDLISPVPVIVLGTPIAIGLSATLAIFASQMLPWSTFVTRDGASGVVVVLVTMVELGQWVGILYAGGIVITGTGLILWSFQRYPHLDSTTGTVLCTFGTVPWVSVLFALQLESISFFVFSGTVAVGFGIGALAAGALVGPASLFDRVPAAGNVGPTTVIEELEDAVIITDGEGEIIELNPSARRLFGLDQGAVSMHITELLDSPLSELRKRRPVEIYSDTRQHLFDTTVSDLTDQHGHLLGHAIVLRDATETTIRKQRLEVLNRLLRHNLRNDMTVVLGRLSMIRAKSDDPSVLEGIDTIDRTGRELVALSDKIRESEQLLSSDTDTIQRIQVESLVRELFAGLEPDKEVEFHYEGAERIAIVATWDQLRLALENLVTNAVKHNDKTNPEVWVRITRQPDEHYPLEIAVLDNGPGIPEQERKAMTSGEETPLMHSSGLGLWTVHWIARSLGGKISLADRDPSGAVVKLLIPTQSTEVADTDEDQVIKESFDDGG